MNASLLGAVSVCAVTLTISISSNAALISKLGGQVVYDTDLDITWVADANLATSNTFGLPIEEDLGTHPLDSSGAVGVIIANGTMYWPGALFWIDAMNAANYLGVNDWRLPTTNLIPISSCSGVGLNCSGEELGHLFYEEFGATSGASVLTSSDPTELAKFTNIEDFYYWYGTEDDADSAYAFNFFNGVRVSNGKLGVDFNPFVLPVRDGDIVPIPVSGWLFASGLLGLIGISRRKKSA
jgi:hypothetical protein